MYLVFRAKFATYEIILLRLKRDGKYWKLASKNGESSTTSAKKKLYEILPKLLAICAASPLNRFTIGQNNSRRAHSVHTEENVTLLWLKSFPNRHKHELETVRRKPTFRALICATFCIKTSVRKLIHKRWKLKKIQCDFGWLTEPKMLGGRLAFLMKIFLSHEAHFHLSNYMNNQIYRIWSSKNRRQDNAFSKIDYLMRHLDRQYDWSVPNKTPLRSFMSSIEKFHALLKRRCLLPTSQLGFDSIGLVFVARL